VPESGYRPEMDGPKRRSARIVQPVPVMITGVDALGRTFQERTSTVTVNCHGCRYLSKHYVLKNMWVNLEVPHNETGRPPRKVRGRVSWIQRPRTVRELFQVGVELETSGNFWGIAFPPGDWFPFPDTPKTAEAHPMDENVERPGIEVSGHSTQESASTPREQEVSNLRVIPMPHSVDTESALERHVARLVAEAQEQLHSTARESASRAVEEQTRPLLSALEGQLKEATEKSVDTAISAQLGQLQHEMQAKLDAEHDARIEQIRADLALERHRQIDEARAQIEAQLGLIEQGRRSSFDQEIQSRVEDANKRIEKLSETLGANAHLAQAAIEQVRRMSREAAEQESRVWQERLQQQEVEGQKRIVQFEEAAGRLGDQISMATAEVEARWRGILDSELGTAQAKLSEKIETSIDAAVNRAAERLGQSTRAIEEQLENRVASLLSRTEGETEANVAALRDSIGLEVTKSQGLLSELRELSGDVEAQRSEFSSLIESSKAQLAQQGEALLEAQDKELALRADAAIAGLADRLQPALESSCQETITRLVTQFEERIAPHVGRAAEIVNELSLTEVQSNSLVSQHRDLLLQASERILQDSVSRTKEILDQMERNVGEAAQIASAKWAAELDAKASETTQNTFEALYKSADWYEKKMQTQMQSFVEKGLQEADSGMREKAGEISGLFAGELDRYSRGFVEHAQKQIEDHAEEAVGRTRLQMSQAADAAASGFVEKAGQLAQEQVIHWQEETSATFARNASRAEEHAAQIRLQLTQKTESLANEFLNNLSRNAQETLTNANQELIAQFVRTKEQLSAEGQSVESELKKSMESLGIRSMEEYRQRLENSSNSWILTTVSKLHQQSEGLMEQIASFAESRLRTTCNEVFSEMGDMLRQRLSGLMLAPEAQRNEPLNHKTAAQGSQG
jgi:hypothetical protein